MSWRKYDKNWADRVFYRLPQVLSISFKNGKLTNVKSQKEIIKGTEKMSNFMKKYWVISSY